MDWHAKQRYRRGARASRGNVARDCKESLVTGSRSASAARRASSAGPFDPAQWPLLERVLRARLETPLVAQARRVSADAGRGDDAYLPRDARRSRNAADAVGAALGRPAGL
jgi:hypothetical protein